MLQDLEWVNSSDSVELRWGVRTKPGNALRNSTRIAIIQRDPEFKGVDTWKIKMTLLHDLGDAETKVEYPSKQAAQKVLLFLLTKQFDRMQYLTTALTYITLEKDNSI